jgi:hypothetical protein
MGLTITINNEEVEVAKMEIKSVQITNKYREKTEGFIKFQKNIYYLCMMQQEYICSWLIINNNHQKTYPSSFNLRKERAAYI